MANTIEQKVIEIVMKYEKLQGREPKDVSRTKCGYDIKSTERYIEVKGQSKKRAGRIRMDHAIVRIFGKDSPNYYIYIVYDIKNEPKLKILEPDVIFKNLKIDTLFLLPTGVINKYGKDVKL